MGGKTTTISTSETKLEAFRIQSSCYGIPVPLVWGQTRIPGNLFWYNDFVAIAHTTTTSNGGKGGGGTKQVDTKYTYQAAVQMGLCHGTIYDIPVIWKGKTQYVTIVTTGTISQKTESVLVNLDGTATVPDTGGAFTSNGYVMGMKPTDVTMLSLFADVSPNTPVYESYSYKVDAVGNYQFDMSQAGAYVAITYNYYSVLPGQIITAAEQLGLTIFTGGEGQVPWSYLSSAHPDQALAYPTVAYVASADYDLDSSASIDNHNFEIIGPRSNTVPGFPDASPSDVIYDLLCDPRFGAGFPQDAIADMTDYGLYCRAWSLLISPAITQQSTAADIIKNICDMTNSSPVWSGGKLKIVPYGDSAISNNGVSWTPVTAALYDLNDNDFISGEGEEPVKMTRSPNADAYNHVLVEFCDRNNQYNKTTTEAKDQANIEAFGLRSRDPIQADWVCDQRIARNIAQLALQRVLYIRNTYEFTCSWAKILLEPMDIITLTDSGLGLNRLPVRITQVEESETGDLTFTCEDYLGGVANAPFYPSQVTDGFSHNYNTAPGPVIPPTIFEAPLTLTTTGLEVYAAVTGQGKFWGGCSVWVSADGNNYQRQGSIYGGARYGQLTAALAQGASTASVRITTGTMLSGSAADAQQGNTLCYADGEYFSYVDATLTSAQHYDLTNLVRGFYSTTDAAHANGVSFVRVDDAIASSGVMALTMVGQTIYFKFTSFNIYQGAEESLADVIAYPYKITGSILKTPLPTLTGLATNYVSKRVNIYWNPVSDFRQPAIDYEIRVGAAWATAQVIGRTPLTNFTAPADGSYWISAHYMMSNGENVYSSAPTEITITGATLVSNVIATYDEAATGWSGTLNNTIITGSTIELGPLGNILTEADFLSLPDVLWDQGVATSGYYTLPTGHEVDIGRVAGCQVLMTYTAYAQSIYDNFLGIVDLLAYPDLFGAYLGPLVSVQPQIAIAQADGIYGAWENYQPGVYNAQYFKARLLLTSSDSTTTVIVSQFVFSVDVPDRVDPYQITTSASAAVTVTYTSPFNGGVGSGLPLIQATILNAQPGDDVQITSANLAGCQLQVYNAGSRVVRTVNIQVQGF